MGDAVDKVAGKAVDKPADEKAGKVSRRTKAGIAVIAACLAAGGIWYYTAGQRRWPETELDLGNNVKMRLVLIPAGKFMMGSPATEVGREADEGPQHEVTISKPFYMGVFEVTQEQYEQVMGANPSYSKGAKNPVETVTWDDAVEFCKKLSARMGKKVMLPTEARWEYACRAGTTTAFHTGDALKPNQANFSRAQANAAVPSNPGVWDRIMAWLGISSSQKANIVGTKPAGSFPPNGFGLYDMHGNVWEWCSDWYDDSYANTKNQDPTGPDSGGTRLLRGGGCDSAPWDCRSASRGRSAPDYRAFNFGFRVAVDSE